MSAPCFHLQEILILPVLRLLPLAFVAALSTLSALPAPAVASGAWTTFVRPYTCRDLLPESGVVWIATGEAGLLRYDRALAAFTTINREPGGLASNGLTSLALDGIGRLWVGTVAQGVSRLSSDRRTWDLVNAFDGLLSDSVTVLEADGDTMWIGTTKGLVLWNGREVAGTVPDGINPSPFANDRITGVVVSGDTLFVSTPAGVYLSRLSTNLAVWTAVNGGLIDTDVGSLAAAGLDVFAVAGTGTHRWNHLSGAWGLAGGNGSVRRLRDDSGIITSVSGLGIFRWDSNAWTQVSASPASDGSPDGGIEVALDSTGFGFAAARVGFYAQASPAWTLLEFPGPVGNNTQSIAIDRDRVYVGTFAEGFSRLANGVWRNWSPVFCTAGCDTVFRSPGYPFAILADGLGQKWVGCWGSAISMFTDDASPPAFRNLIVNDGVVDSLRHTFAWSALDDRAGGRWFGMDTDDRGTKPPIGLDLYDSLGTFIRNYPPGTPGLNDGQIRALSLDRLGQMWVGYAGKGIDKVMLPATLGGTLAFSDIGSSSTLDMFGIVARGDSVWVLSTDGLRRLRPTDSAISGSTPYYSIPASPAPRGAVHPLDVANDGTVYVGTTSGVRAYRPGGGTEDFTETNSPLANNEVRSVVVDRATGQVWFATSTGLNRYDPGYVAPPAPQLPSLRVSLYPNPIRLTGIGIELRLTGNAESYAGAVLDLGGRQVRRFTAAANGRVVWDGRGEDGELVRPGVYFLHVQGGGREAVARVAVLR